MIKTTRDKLVKFDPIEHKYTDNDGRRLISVSQLIHKFTNPFDPTGYITENYAKKHGLTVEQVKEKWKIINEESCTYGSSVHEELEYYIEHNKIRESEHKDIVEEFAKIKFEGILHSERIVYSLEDMVAGQVDVIEVLPNKTINIWDFKTNKELKKKNLYGQTMLDCLWRFDDVNFNQYQIQLSLYAYLCELKGLKINKLTILYINPKTRKIEHHPVKYLRKDIINILKKNKEFVY